MKTVLVILTTFMGLSYLSFLLTIGIYSKNDRNPTPFLCEYNFNKTIHGKEHYYYTCQNNGPSQENMISLDLGCLNIGCKSLMYKSCEEDNIVFAIPHKCLNETMFNIATIYSWILVLGIILCTIINNIIYGCGPKYVDTNHQTTSSTEQMEMTFDNPLYDNSEDDAHTVIITSNEPRETAFV